jgi:hypothetical protein
MAIWSKNTRSLKIPGIFVGGAQDDIRKSPPGYYHVSPLYIQVQCLYNTLMQCQYPESSEVQPWIKRGPEIVVKIIQYNHLTDTTTITHQMPMQIPVSELVDYDYNEYKLYPMYGPNLIVGDGPKWG